ncbi:uncharacterized protein LOC115634697 [Scaptodrosophila lebanonensis]|uniref:Uncharacterized protein LOC115634697 n=1 Tax=Drosophila lebanonensis TaxID=7225 RepID=A0A6J2UJR4_DROLE|nr:uncharacterized protein LOC115634697 [Scaptodrosophila lebanonensis]
MNRLLLVAWLVLLLLGKLSAIPSFCTYNLYPSEVHGLHGDCQFYRHMVEGSNRIFIYSDSTGVYQLQRSEFVPRGVTLFAFCSETDVLESTCQNNDQFSLPLPLSCSNPMNPVVKQISDNSCKASMYAVGYVIGNRMLELYRSCFDAKNGRVLYSESDVYYKSFFAKRPFTDFQTDGLFTPAEAASYAKHNIYESFNCIFGNSQSYIPARALVINRGHLVASADFLFLDQMASTFRYLNVVLQFKSINDGNWEKIERWVRSQIPNTSCFRIRTGGINVLQLTNEANEACNACLAGNKIPVPEWTYKVVKAANGKPIHAFLTYNNIFERERPAAPSFCSCVECPTRLPNTPQDGFTFCCDPESFGL